MLVEFVRIIHPWAVIGCQSEAPRHFHDVPVNSLPYPYVSSTIYRLKYCPTKCLRITLHARSTKITKVWTKWNWIFLFSLFPFLFFFLIIGLIVEVRYGILNLRFWCKNFSILFYLWNFLYSSLIYTVKKIRSTRTIFNIFTIKFKYV